MTQQKFVLTGVSTFPLLEHTKALKQTISKYRRPIDFCNIFNSNLKIAILCTEFLRYTAVFLLYVTQMCYTIETTVILNCVLFSDPNTKYLVCVPIIDRLSDLSVGIYRFFPTQNVKNMNHFNMLLGTKSMFVV